VTNFKKSKQIIDYRSSYIENYITISKALIISLFGNDTDGIWIVEDNKENVYFIELIDNREADILNFKLYAKTQNDTEKLWRWLNVKFLEAQTNQ
jgi:hypothetical protein